MVITVERLVSRYRCQISKARGYQRGHLLPMLPTYVTFERSAPLLTRHAVELRRGSGNRLPKINHSYVRARVSSQI